MEKIAKIGKAESLWVVLLIGIIVSLIMFRIIFLSSEARGAENTSAQLPDFQAGDYWIYKNDEKGNFKLEFLRQEKDLLVFLQDNDGIVIYKNLQLGNVKAVNTKTGNYIFSYEHARPAVQFPLKIGKKWSFCYSSETVNNIPIVLTLNYEIDAYKTVRVRAGEFDIFEILCRVMVTGHKNGKVIYEKFDFAHWYAPKAKNLIKIIDLSESELVEYRVK